MFTVLTLCHACIFSISLLSLAHLQFSFWALLPELHVSKDYKEKVEQPAHICTPSFADIQGSIRVQVSVQRCLTSQYWQGGMQTPVENNSLDLAQRLVQ